VSVSIKFLPPASSPHYYDERNAAASALAALNIRELNASELTAARGIAAKLVASCLKLDEDMIQVAIDDGEKLDKRAECLAIGLMVHSSLVYAPIERIETVNHTRHANTRIVGLLEDLYNLGRRA
jgi:hypothetical protein